MAVSVELKRAWREFRKEHTAPIYSREAQLAMGDWAGGLAQGLLSTEVLGFIGNKITQSNKKLYKRIVEKQGQVRIDVQRDGNFRVNPQAITDTSLPRYLLRKPDVIPSVINDLIVSPEVIKDTLVKQATRITFGEKTAPSEVTSDQIGMLAQAVLGLAIEAKINLRDLQTATSSNPGKKQSLTESVFKIPFDEFFIPEKVVSGCLFDEEKGVYTDTRGREHHLTINSQGETFVLVKGVGGRYYFKTINGQDTTVLRETALGLEQKLISKREFIHLSNIRERRAPESRLNSLMTNMGDFVFNVFQTVANGRNRINVIRRLTQFLTGSREIRITPDHRGLFMHKGRIIKTFTYPHIGQLNWLEGNQYTNESETPVDVSGIELTVTENILTRLRDLIWEMLNKNASSVKVGETSLSAAD